MLNDFADLAHILARNRSEDLEPNIRGARELASCDYDGKCEDVPHRPNENKMSDGWRESVAAG
jgi:hypothetical protein